MKSFITPAFLVVLFVLISMVHSSPVPAYFDEESAEYIPVRKTPQADGGKVKPKFFFGSPFGGFGGFGGFGSPFGFETETVDYYYQY